MRLNVEISLLLFSLLVALSHCGNVLIISVTSSQSHKNVLYPVMNRLADKNHTVTILTAFQPKSAPKKNVQEVVIIPGFDFFPGVSTMEIRKGGVMGMFSLSMDHMFEACRNAYKNPKMQEILSQKWDAVLFDAIGNNCFYGLVHKLQAPLILVSTCSAPAFFTQFFGNRLPASFVPDPLLPFMDKMSFWERTMNFALQPLVSSVWVMNANTEEKIYREYMGEDTPGITEIMSEASLLLMNSHFSLNFPRPVLPDVVEIGGGHCKAGKPLPKDIEDFVAGAENGFIFFSLGSIVKPEEISDEIRNVFINVFNRLNVRVLWKWPQEKMPGLSDNVKLLKWAPQQDILAHPKIKIFITHGGLLSTQESVYHGVPIIGFPVFADQDLNSQQATRAGFGETLEILDVTEEQLESTIKKILKDPSYGERAKNLSVLFRDRNGHPSDDGVYWTEYVMRHKGARHLRSAARELNFLQYHSIDVALFLLGVLGLVLWLLKLLVVKLVSKCRPRQDNLTKKNK